jgi:hypothetical protein
LFIFSILKKHKYFLPAILNAATILNSTEVEQIIFKAKRVLDVEIKYLIAMITLALLLQKTLRFSKTKIFSLEHIFVFQLCCLLRPQQYFQE